jgi:hypothetical protein
MFTPIEDRREAQHFGCLFLTFENTLSCFQDGNSFAVV